VGSLSDSLLFILQSSWLQDNLHHVVVNGRHGFSIQQLLIENAKGVVKQEGGKEGEDGAPCVNSLFKPWGGGEPLQRHCARPRCAALVSRMLACS